MPSILPSDTIVASKQESGAPTLLGPEEGPIEGFLSKIIGYAEKGATIYDTYNQLITGKDKNAADRTTLPVTQIPSATTTGTKPKDDTLLYIAFGVAALVLVMVMRK